MGDLDVRYVWFRGVRKGDRKLYNHLRDITHGYEETREIERESCLSTKEEIRQLK